MAKNLLDLANSLNSRAKKIGAVSSDAAVHVAQTIVFDLAFKTPVDTSQALSNWIVTLDRPSSAKIEPYFHGEKGSSQRASAAETINAAKFVLKNKKPGQPIYITNNQPYIKWLNEGNSGQQPEGFVERAILVGRKALSNFKAKVN